MKAQKKGNTLTYKQLRHLQSLYNKVQETENRLGSAISETPEEHAAYVQYRTCREALIQALLEADQSELIWFNWTEMQRRGIIPL